MNDNRYCPDCKQVVDTALSAIPGLFERVWVETSDYTVPQLLSLAAEQAASNPFAFIRRVSVPLFNLETGEMSCGGYIRVGEKHYHYHYWPGREAEGTVKVEMEKNLETGALTPWLPVQ